LSGNAHGGSNGKREEQEKEKEKEKGDEVTVREGKLKMALINLKKQCEDGKQVRLGKLKMGLINSEAELRAVKEKANGGDQCA
jgi:hypothetical protein